MSNIPIYQPYIASNQIAYVNECLEENWISSRGRFIKQFEDSLKGYVGCPELTTCSNGTVALHLALLALNISPGDEVIVPSFTYIASVNAIKYVGAIPVFVDIDINDWNISIADIEKKISNKTRAIMCVHMYGAPCKVEELVKISKHHNLFLIEDCAESFGSWIENSHTGTFGDIATFSFFGNKTITTGEGGAVFSNNKDLIQKVAHLKNQAILADGSYQHDEIGYNYRMTNIQAAIGCAQLEDIEIILNLKRLIANRYRDLLRGIVDFQNFKVNTTSNWIVTILLSSIHERDVVFRKLSQQHVETRPGFPLVHKMKCYESLHPIHLEVSERISSRAICLPSFPDLTKEQQDFIISTIKN